MHVLCDSGLLELGKNWAEIAGRVGSKTGADCHRFYHAERQKLALDDLVADYHASKATVVVFTLLSTALHWLLYCCYTKLSLFLSCQNSPQCTDSKKLLTVKLILTKYTAYNHS